MMDVSAIDLQIAAAADASVAIALQHTAAQVFPLGSQPISPLVGLATGCSTLIKQQLRVE
jgi:hypothetical protein